MLKNITIRKTGFALLAVLSVGLFLRMYNLAHESLWLDEQYSIDHAHLSLPQMIGTLSRDVNQPCYFIILHYWIRVFGDSEFSTRFLSVIFGFLALYCMYRVGALLFDKETGVLSSLFLGVSLFHIRYSQEAKMYSLVSLLALCSMYFFIRLLKNGNVRVSAGYVLFSVLLLYTHGSGLFIIMAQNAYLLLHFFLWAKESGFTWKRWVCLQLQLFILFIPWFKIYIYQARAVLHY